MLNLDKNLQLTQEIDNFIFKIKQAIFQKSFFKCN